MFVAGKMFGSPEEAKKWVEDNVKAEERRHWMVLELEGEDSPSTKPPGTVEGSVIPSKEP